MKENDIRALLKDRDRAVEAAAEALRQAIAAERRIYPALRSENAHWGARERDARKIVERALRVTWLDKIEAFNWY